MHRTWVCALWFVATSASCIRVADLPLLEATGGLLSAGILFRVGMFGAGVSWISESFQFNNLHGPIVPLLTLSFVAFLALFPALWGALLAISRGRLGKRATILVLGPVLWVLLEWCRGWFLTGFTWLQFGYATIDTQGVTLE